MSPQPQRVHPAQAGWDGIIANHDGGDVFALLYDS